MKVWFTVRTTIFFACICFVSSCSNDSSSTPEEVVFAYVNHLAKNNHTAAKELLTPKAKKTYDELLRLGLHYQQTEISKSDIQCREEANRSSCTYCCNHVKSEVTLNLIKEKGADWQVVLHEIDQQNLETLEERLMESQETKLNKALKELSEGD